MIISIVVVKDKNGYESFGTSSAFPVPDKYVDDIIKTDLGNVMANIFKQTDLRSGKGGISFLTHNQINRMDLIRESFIMAFTQFINGDIWKN